MSNRILAILILLGFGGAIYAFYLYFYVYYQGDIEISSNLDNYSIVLYSDTVKRSFTQNCESSSCLFVGIPPVEYTLTATASGYSDITHTLTVPKSDVTIEALNFQKIITLEPVSDVFQATLSTAQKIKQITTRKLYKLVDNSAGVYYVTKDTASVKVQSPTDVIGVFDFHGDKGDIKIQAVRGSKDTIWLKIGDDHYLYNLIYKQLSVIGVKNIEYIKKHGEYSFLVIGDDKLYKYSPNTNTLDSQESLDDFIVYGEDIIYLAQQKGKSIIKIKSKILLETDKKLSQIYIQNNRIYIEDEKDTIYTLEGLEE